MKKSQRERIIDRLLKFGFVTRNQCLSQYPAITRLGAIVCSLNAEGWELEGKNIINKGTKDYIYTVKNKPYKKVVYRLPNGEEIITNERI